MDTGLISMIGIGAFALVVFLLAVVGVYKSLYRKVGPNEVLVISGRKGDSIEDDSGERHRLGFRIVKGGGSLINPILERSETMSLELITLDIVTPEFFTNVDGTRGMPLMTARKLAAQIRVAVAPQGPPLEGLAIEFTGFKDFQGQDNKLTYTPAPGEKPEDVRKGVAGLIKIGLLSYAAKTPSAKDLSVRFLDQAKPTSVNDPWNFWVFSLSANAFLMGETQYRSGSYYGSFSANRTTPRFKIRTSVYGNLSTYWFDLGDGTAYKAATHGYGGSALAVKSLGEHWSAGIFVDAESTGRAMHGDRVMVRLKGPSKGRVVRILSRAHPEVVGRFRYNPRGSFVIPFDGKIRELETVRTTAYASLTEQLRSLATTQPQPRCFQSRLV